MGPNQAIPMFRILQRHSSSSDGSEADASGDSVIPLRALDQGQSLIRTMLEVVGRLGIEPRTQGLKVLCSAS